MFVDIVRTHKFKRFSAVLLVGGRGGEQEDGSFWIFWVECQKRKGAGLNSFEEGAVTIIESMNF